MAGVAFCNILAGGIIGAAVDMSSGAAYKYPAQVIVPMALPAAPVLAVVTPAAPAVVRPEGEAEKAVPTT
jgi:hypothetical protein